MDQRESMGPSAPVLELMEQGMTVMRVENENLQAMAIQRPRDLDRLTKAALAELRAFPQFAAKAYYSIPYKDKYSPTGTTLVEGPSIKAANALNRFWGNCSSGFRIVGSDEERIMVQGVFIDHETGMRRTAEISVSRKAITKDDKKTYFLDANRLNMAIQAGGSKAVRNAILNSLPVGLVDVYFSEAKSIAARGGKEQAPRGTPTDTAQIMAQMEECIQRLEGIGITREEVMDYVNRHTEFKDEEAVCAHLIGVLNAVEDGQTSIDEVFTAPTASIAEPQRASTPATRPAPAKPYEAPKQELPADRQRTQAKFDGASCPICKKTMKKGTWIWKNNGKWMHEEC